MTTVMLENAQYRVQIRSKGAELASFFDKMAKLEYIWHADPAFWGRSAPILFPHVGRVTKDELIIDGKHYPSTQHGFARDRIFSVMEQSDTKVLFRLTEDEKTLVHFPYAFELFLGYELVENQLHCSWQVKNPNDETLYYGIGGHPAFRVPLEEGVAFEDYTLTLFPKKERKRIPVVAPRLDPRHAYPEQVDELALTRELFHDDALVYETNGSTEIVLKSKRSKHSVAVRYDNIPYVGLWSMYPQEAPFVCIEPWCSFADTPEDTGDFKTKYSVQRLKIGEVFETSYTICVE